MEEYRDTKQYLKGTFSGYDRSGSQGLWRFSDGTRGKMRDVLAKRRIEDQNTDGTGLFGFVVPNLIPTPATDRLDKIETIISGSLDIDEIISRATGKKANQMPGNISAMMRLSELYCDTEGDIFQLIETPMDLSLHEITVESPDTGFQKDLEDVYRRIALDDVMADLWLTTKIYGQSFPLEVYDKDEIVWIVSLNPKSMNVGVERSGLSLGISSPGEKWNKEALETMFDPMMYHSFGPDFNEKSLSGNIPISREFCCPVRDKVLRFQRYAVPSLARAFRSIGTRRIMEEMMRATMEGYRNQLWLFLLGDPDHPPSPTHINALKSAVEGAGGDRTGSLVWYNAPLEVKTVAPASFDEMSGMDAYLKLTQHIYRQLGVHISVVSGESSAQGSSSSDKGLDVRILLERNKPIIRSLLNFEFHLRQNIARKTLKIKDSGDVWNSVLRTRVRMARSPLEVEGEVKNVLMPMIQSGNLSRKTFLERSGVSTYEVELERKKKEEPDAHLFAPVPSYSQTTVKPGTQPSESNTAPQGRPVVKVDASFEGEPLFDQMLSEVYAGFDQLLESEISPEEFVSHLRAKVEEYAVSFAEMGYKAAGGSFKINETWVSGSSTFVNSFASGLLDAIESTDDVSSLDWRVYLYPQEARHLSYLYGVQQAMAERGAKGWRRVLHPELSTEGPCMDCIRDSAVVHSIEEPFWEPHPFGKCGMSSIVYYISEDHRAIEVPIPAKITTPTLIREIIEKIGKVGKWITRRIRGER